MAVFLFAKKKLFFYECVFAYKKNALIFIDVFLFIQKKATLKGKLKKEQILIVNYSINLKKFNIHQNIKKKDHILLLKIILQKNLLELV